MTAAFILVPFVPGMETEGFHSYEEAEESGASIDFSDSSILPPESLPQEVPKEE